MCDMRYPSGDDSGARWVLFIAGLVIIAVIVFA
jgi:hypothetical protein